MPDFFSTREIAELLLRDAAETWRIQRLYETGAVPEPPRFAGKRAIPKSDIPLLIDALRNRGWLPDQQGAAS